MRGAVAERRWADFDIPAPLPRVCSHIRGADAGGSAISLEQWWFGARGFEADAANRVLDPFLAERILLPLRLRSATAHVWTHVMICVEAIFPPASSRVRPRMCERTLKASTQIFTCVHTCAVAERRRSGSKNRSARNGSNTQFTAPASKPRAPNHHCPQEMADPPASAPQPLRACVNVALMWCCLYRQPAAGFVRAMPHCSGYASSHAICLGRGCFTTLRELPKRVSVNLIFADGNLIPRLV